MKSKPFSELSFLERFFSGSASFSWGGRVAWLNGVAHTQTTNPSRPTFEKNLPEKQIISKNKSYNIFGDKVSSAKDG